MRGWERWGVGVGDEKGDRGGREEEKQVEAGDEGRRKKEEKNEGEIRDEKACLRWKEVQWGLGGSSLVS